MTWKTMSRELAEHCEIIVERWRKVSSGDFDGDYPMIPDRPLSYTVELAGMLREWVMTVRQVHKNGTMPGMYGPDWFPTSSDFYKSALFERIRSGLKPLPEPPPVGLACPWYAVVEDPGPHFVYDVKEAGEFGQWFEDLPVKPTVDVFVLNTGYRVTEKIGPKNLIIRDGRHNTSYRFRLWYDPEFTWPGRVSAGYTARKGGWLMQNVEFGEQ